MLSYLHKQISYWKRKYYFPTKHWNKGRQHVVQSQELTIICLGMLIHRLFNYIVSVAETVNCGTRRVNGYGESERDLSYLKLVCYPDSA